MTTSEQNFPHPKTIPHAFGREEMNFLEYGICSSGTKVDRKTKEIVFEEPAWDRRTSTKITRKLTVGFSTAVGRPTRRDDEILLALMTLAWQDKFASPKLYFTRYQICQLLDWPDEGRNYKRIDEGIKRLKGVHLNFDNSFWDKTTESWVDRIFSLIDDGELYDREHYDRRRERTPESRPKSWIRWGEPLYESLKGGNIKKVDLSYLKNLDESFAKRLFRWLDKNFYNRRHVQITLRELAVKKLGLADGYKTSRLKELLGPAFRELERRGAVKPASNERRYQPSKTNPKLVEVHFDRAYNPKAGGPGGNRSSTLPSLATTTDERPPHQHDSSPADSGTTSLETPREITAALVQRGVSSAQAKRLVQDDPEECRYQIEHYDWKLSTGWRPDKSSGGWLNAAIRDKIRPSESFKTREEREAEAKERAAKQQARQQAEEDRLEAQRVETESRYAPLWGFWETLSPEERLAFERAAIQQTDLIKRESFFRHAKQVEGLLQAGEIQRPCERPGPNRKGSVLSDYREMILLEHYQRTRVAG